MTLSLLWITRIPLRQLFWLPSWLKDVSSQTKLGHCVRTVCVLAKRLLHNANKRGLFSVNLDLKLLEDSRFCRVVHFSWFAPNFFWVPTLHRSPQTRVCCVNILTVQLETLSQSEVVHKLVFMQRITQRHSNLHWKFVISKPVSRFTEPERNKLYFETTKAFLFESLFFVATSAKHRGDTMGSKNWTRWASATSWKRQRFRRDPCVENRSWNSWWLYSLSSTEGKKQCSCGYVWPVPAERRVGRAEWAPQCRARGRPAAGTRFVLCGTRVRTVSRTPGSPRQLATIFSWSWSFENDKIGTLWTVLKKDAQDLGSLSATAAHLMLRNSTTRTHTTVQVQLLEGSSYIVNKSSGLRSNFPDLPVSTIVPQGVAQYDLKESSPVQRYSCKLGTKIRFILWFVDT